MKNRSEAREIAIKSLYKMDILKNAKVEYDIKEVIKEECEIQNDFVEELVQGILEHQKEIDQLADKYLKDWTLSRLNKVDQAILRVGIYELMYTNTPSVVAINEAVELSKKYSEEAVTKMINAVLDSIYHEEEKE